MTEVEEAKYAVSRELWALRREPTLTDFGRGMCAGLARAWHTLTGDWKINEPEIMAYWEKVEAEKNASKDTS